jgi:hypothetical protein
VAPVNRASPFVPLVSALVGYSSILIVPKETSSSLSVAMEQFTILVGLDLSGGLLDAMAALVN